jgi:hypothetical protein
MTQPVLQHLCQVLYDSPFGTAIRESDNAFSIIESVHVLVHHTSGGDHIAS